MKAALFTLLCFFLGATSAKAQLSVLACEPEWASLAQELAGELARVSSATTNNLGGNVVWIRTPHGQSHYYAHLDEHLVAVVVVDIGEAQAFRLADLAEDVAADGWLTAAERQELERYRDSRRRTAW